MRAATAEEIDEHLKDLEVDLNRLRIEYEQYFLGNARRVVRLVDGRVAGDESR